jgi:hypothetical protein
MVERRFSKWHAWSERAELSRCECPGVYAIARSKQRLAGQAFSLRKDIIYFGMTNAVSGLRGRLKQFDDTISGKRLAHGGADRVRRGFPSYGRLVPKLYVSVAPFACDPASNKPADLRRLGNVARFEYLCFAAFAERFEHLPRFNDKRNSPKFSKRVAT